MSRATVVAQGASHWAALMLALSLAIWFTETPVQAQASPGFEHTPYGVRAQEGGETLEITALREDAVRVRMWQGTAEPEDASWANLPEALHRRAKVIAEAAGFSTGKLHVAIGPYLALTVTDSAGQVLQEDAEPVLRHGTSFRLYKRRTTDDHFFGLGDKPGPLDRSGEAFVLWNTDHFGWQESTDPIYKSIAFFLTMRQGRTLGVFFNNTYRSFFDFGRENEHEYSFGAVDGACDYMLLYGPAPRQVLEDYAWLVRRRCHRCGRWASSNCVTPTRRSRNSPTWNTACAPIASPPMCFGWTLTSRRTTCRSRSILSAFPTSPSW
jgi:Galactose mutarotase-like